MNNNDNGAPQPIYLLYDHNLIWSIGSLIKISF